EVKKKSEGMSIFIVDIREAGKALTIKPIRNMVNHETNQLFFDNLEVPAENLIGEEGKGFRYILDGMNAERILVAAESIGDGYFFIDKAVEYGNSRVVFGRPISQNQGVQFPIAQAYAHVHAADLMRYKAASLFDQKEKCGEEANTAKFLAAESAWEAANACMTTYGGYGFATEFDIERKFRECRLFLNAPVPQNLVLAYIGQHVLGMKRSF
ncbi:MAG TPA: acyl-CoA dehydrogenase family protein, partial [Dehalococcoidia bacterium]|nr:acyl-CoA dehydrogenase family protein [Dehalococcoidia bacterium]